MYRPNKLTGKLNDNLTQSEMISLFTYVIKGEIEFFNDTYWAEDTTADVILELVKNNKATINNRFPKRYVLDDNGLIFSNDNKSRLSLLTLENINLFDEENIMKNLPDEFKLTYKYIQEIDTKTALVDWLNEREKDDEDQLDIYMKKADLFKAVFDKYKLRVIETE